MQRIWVQVSLFHNCMEAHVEWDKPKYTSHRPYSNHFLKRQGLLFPGRVYLPGFLSPSNLSKPNNSNPMLHQVAMKALYLPHQNQLYQCPKYTFYSLTPFFSQSYTLLRHLLRSCPNFQEICPTLFTAHWSYYPTSYTYHSVSEKTAQDPRMWVETVCSMNTPGESDFHWSSRITPYVRLNLWSIPVILNSGCTLISLEALKYTNAQPSSQHK